MVESLAELPDRIARQLSSSTARSGRRRFVNHWAFVRFASEQGLELDFSTPPKQPEPRESAKGDEIGLPTPRKPEKSMQMQ